MPSLLPRPAGSLALWVLSVSLALLLGYCFVQSAQAAETKGAGIVPGQSIDGVKLGDTQAQVEQILGKSVPSQFPNDNTGSFGTNLFYPDPPFEGAVELDPQGNVNGLTTNSSHFKTSKGVGVGSPLKAVRKAYPKTKCETLGSNTSEAGSEDCTLKSSYGGQADTLFLTEPKKRTVAQIEIDLQSAHG